MAITSDVLASTLETIRDEAMDQLFIATPLLNAMDKKGGIVPVTQIDGGRRMVVPVVVRNHSTSVDLTAEDSVLPLSFSDVLEDGTYNWAHNAAPVILGKKVELENQGQAARVSVAEVRLKRVMEQMRFELNQKMVGNPAGAKFSDLTTLFGFSDGNGSSTGIFEGLAFGSQTNTVGGIAKSSYVTSWQHQFGDAVDLFGTNGRPQLDLLIADCEQYSMNGGPHLILCNRTVWSNLRRTLVATELYEGTGETKEFGYGRLVYNGVPVDYDRAMPAQVGASDNEELGAYVLNLEDIKLYHLKGAWFELGDWNDGMFSGFMGRGTHLYSAVCLAPGKLSTSGVLVDANTYS